MPLWGNLDHPSGNNKPVFANTSNTTSASTINGTSANTVEFYGNVYGVSRGEMANTNEKGVVHAGWVSQKIIEGGILSVDIVSAGANTPNTGFVRFYNNANATGDFASVGGANASFTAVGGVLQTITLKNRGQYKLPPTANIANSSAVLSVKLGFKAGAKLYETLVAEKSITGDDPKDNFYFPGV